MYAKESMYGRIAAKEIFEDPNNFVKLIGKPEGRIIFDTNEKGQRYASLQLKTVTPAPGLDTLRKCIHRVQIVVEDNPELSEQLEHVAKAINDSYEDFEELSIYVSGTKETGERYGKSNPRINAESIRMRSAKADENKSKITGYIVSSPNARTDRNGNHFVVLKVSEEMPAYLVNFDQQHGQHPGRMSRERIHRIHLYGEQYLDVVHQFKLGDLVSIPSGAITYKKKSNGEPEAVVSVNEGKVAKRKLKSERNLQ